MTKEQIGNTLNDAISITENGAIGYRTTGHELLDLNFATSSLRHESEDKIVKRFVRAYCEDPRLAVKWLFFCRDCRGGMGERRTFRTILKWLAKSHADQAKALVELVAEYGRVDDLLPLLDTPVKDEVVAYFAAQLAKDMDGMAHGASISLLAKWMPSCNTSSTQTRRQAKKLRLALGLTECEYRKTLSKLRGYLKVVETKMSANEWGQIDYEAVPSRAAIIYRKAFHRHDAARHQTYLDSLANGKAKINASVSFPHDIVHAYRGGECNRTVYGKGGTAIGQTNGLTPRDVDQTLESAWKALPDYVKGAGAETICVVDGSGSMTTLIGNTLMTALEVANALGLYFAERLSGPFKDMFITFSEHPQLVDVSKAVTLHDKLEIAYSHCECANTNIAKTFDLILETAVCNHLSQDELPKNVLVLSDMEFDGCCDFGGGCRGLFHWRKIDNGTLFAGIARKCEQAGYKLPRLVFWNLNSRTGTIPVKENELGVALVSGFSPAIAKMVLSETLDPYQCLIEQLDSPRYDLVDAALVKTAA